MEEVSCGGCTIDENQGYIQNVEFAIAWNFLVALTDSLYLPI